MNAAWAAWKFSTKELFWSLVALVSQAIAVRDESARQLNILHPNKPRDLWAAGFVLFMYEPWSSYRDAWSGYWRSADEIGRVEFKFPEYSCFDWSRVPWHKAEFKEGGFQFEIRAVPKAYADKHLKPQQLAMAA